MFQTILARNMEDLFFLEQEKKLAEARQKLELMQETKENLSAISGITDEAVLHRLIELDIRPEVLATLLMIPLIEVAWSDGELHEKERAFLVDSVNQPGMHTRNVDPEILEVWMKKRPSPELFDAWELYIQALSAQLSHDERQTLKEDVMADARKIAEAAGGFLGLGKISDAEQTMLDKLEAAFDIACEA
jgi:hypothetical protein